MSVIRKTKGTVVLAFLLAFGSGLFAADPASYAFFTNWSFSFDIEKDIDLSLIPQQYRRDRYMPNDFSLEVMSPYGFLAGEIGLYEKLFHTKVGDGSSEDPAREILKFNSGFNFSLVKSWKQGSRGRGVKFTHSHGRYARFETHFETESFWNGVTMTNIVAEDSAGTNTAWFISEEVLFETGRKPFKGKTFHSLSAGLRYTHWEDGVRSFDRRDNDPDSPFTGTNLTRRRSTHIDQPQNQFKLFCDWNHSLGFANWFQMYWNISGNGGWSPLSSRTTVTDRYLQTSGTGLSTYRYTDLGHSFQLEASPGLYLVFFFWTVGGTYGERLTFDLTGETLTWSRGGYAGSVESGLGRIVRRQSYSGYYRFSLLGFYHESGLSYFHTTIRDSSRVTSAHGDSLGAFERDTIYKYKSTEGMNFRNDFGYSLDTDHFQGAIGGFLDIAREEEETDLLMGFYLRIGITTAGWDRKKVMKPETRSRTILKLFLGADENYRKKKYTEALQLYIEVLDLDDSSLRAIYNIACIYGLTGHNASCLLWLNRLLTRDKSLAGRVEKDPDFGKIAKTPEFQDLISKYR